MAQDRRHNEALARLLRRQFSSEVLRRHLRAWPLFRVTVSFPSAFEPCLKGSGEGTVEITKEMTTAERPSSGNQERRR